MFCNMNPRCTMVCLDDGQCNVYYIIYSRLYDPDKYTNFQEEPLGECYSRFFFKNDITPTIKRLLPSSEYSWNGDYTPAQNVIDGVYISDQHRSFSTKNNDLNPSLLIELKETKLIESILLVTRSIDSNFANIFVEIGNEVNALKPFDSYGPVEINAKVIVEFKSSNGPVKGKFIKIFKINQANLIIGELAILGQ